MTFLVIALVVGFAIDFLNRLDPHAAATRLWLESNPSVKELVGEIEDETDRHEPLARRRDDGSVMLRGSLSIDDANEHLETNLTDHPEEALPEGDWESVGGLIVEQLGRPAALGDEVLADGLRLAVQEMRGRRIMWVLVEAQAGDGAPDENDHLRDERNHHDV